MNKKDIKKFNKAFNYLYIKQNKQQNGVNKEDYYHNLVSNHNYFRYFSGVDFYRLNEKKILLALSLLDKIIEFNSNDYYSNLIRGIIKMGSFNCEDEDGIDNINKAIMINDKLAYGYYYRGCYYEYSKNEPNNAKVEFELAISIDPELNCVYSSLGAIKFDLYKEGKYDDIQSIIHDFDKTISSHHGEITIYSLRASAKVCAEDFIGAIYEYDNLIRILPTCDVFYEKRGYSKYKLHDYEGAVYDSFYAIKCDPYEIASYRTRGLANYNLNNYNEAIKDLLFLISKHQNDFEILETLGKCFYYLEKYSAAIKYFTKALNITSDAPELFLMLARANCRIGHLVKANSYYELYLKHFPNDKDVNHEYHRLKSRKITLNKKK